MSWVIRNGNIVNTRDYAQRRGKVEHLLIFPGYKGNPEKGGQETFSYPHKSLRDELKEAQHFIVIGFVFRDAHINSILREAMRSNEKQ